MTFCGNCGIENPEGHRFCFNCGAELPILPEEPEMGYTPTMDNHEIERIGAYDPNVNYYIAPKPVHTEVSYQQPPAPQQFGQPPYQQPPMQGQYGQPQYQQQGYQYNQGQYQQPPMQGQYGAGYAPYGAPRSREPVYLYGAPNNKKGLRFVSIIMAIAALAVTMVSIFVLPADMHSSDTTLFSLGMAKDGIAVLIFAMVSVALAIISLFIPMFSIVSGVCVIATAAIVELKIGISFAMDQTAFILFIVLAVVIMILGIIASMLMGKYVRSNVRNVSLFQCCVLTWKGIRIPEGAQLQPPMQQPQNNYQQGYQQNPYGQPQYQQQMPPQQPPMQPPRPPYQY